MPPSSDPPSEIALVHLVWAPLGLRPLRAFLRSYAARPAGVDHELVILVNGIGLPAAGVADGAGAAEDGARAQPLSPEQLAAELDGVAHRTVVLEEPLIDLAAYGEAARRLEHERICFVNSYSVIRAEGWLGHLARASAPADVGLVGATGSWESRSELVNGSALHWLYQLYKLPSNRRGFPRFPNPHIRTTAFMLERRLLLELGLERARDKGAAYLLESGRHSITSQIRARGLQVAVVGSDGRAYPPEEWPRSRTFRAGGQTNLLVADNRTSQWERADPELRRHLSRQAWREAWRDAEP